jgi:hypothetical protein
MPEPRVLRDPPMADPLPHQRDGHAAVRSYGSAPGELAVCLRHVGLVDRSDLAAMRADAGPRSLDRVTQRLTGQLLATGGTAHLADAWWCRPTPETVLVVGAGGQSIPRIAELLRGQARRHPDLAVDPHLERLAVIGVVGRRTVPLLRTLGVYGTGREPRDVTPCTAVRIGAVDTVWLLESDVSALCCVADTDAAAAEQAIGTAGRPFGLGRVGHDALAQYALLERRRVTGAMRPPA